MAYNSGSSKDALLLAFQKEREEYLKYKEELDELKRATEDLTPTAEFDGETLRLLLPRKPDKKYSQMPDKRMEIIITAVQVGLKFRPDAPMGGFGASKTICFSKSFDSFTLRFTGSFFREESFLNITVHEDAPRIHSSLSLPHTPFGVVWTPSVRAHFQAALDSAWETFSTREINTQ